MSIQRIQDTRRIVESALTTQDPYIDKASSWNQNAASAIVTQGEIYFPPNVGSIAYQNSTSCPWFGTLKKLGFIVTVKMSAGNKLNIWSYGQPGLIETIYETGRYTGILVPTNTVWSSPLGLDAGLAIGDGVRVTEIFFFDADLYTYEDFLQSPNAILQYEQKNTRPEVSVVYPRLGWADGVPNEIVSGRWLGNQLYYSEEVQQSLWSKGGVSVSINAATAPDGNNTADRITASATGRIYQRNIAGSSGQKTFSAWVKAVSGTVDFRFKLTDGSGAIYDEVAYTANTTWKRYFLTGTIPANGYGVELELNSIVGIDVWGLQLVDGDTPGAYTYTTTALLPAGTKPSSNPLPSEMPATYAVIGDRLENTAWDGKFSTPIAWVCVGPGNPGTWKAVNLFDAKNSSFDPYLYSYIGPGKWSTEGSITPIISNGSLAFGPFTSGQYLQEVGPCPCAVAYELLNLSLVATVSGAGGSIVLRAAQDATNALALATPGGTASLDITVASSAPTPGIIVLLANAVGCSGVITKALIRPKYPFLTGAPSSFAALPSTLANQWILGNNDVWYVVAGAVTYAAGALSFIVNTSGLIQNVTKYLVKTIRIRINITAINAGSIPYVTVSTQSGGEIARYMFTAALGIQERVLLTPSNGMNIAIADQTTNGFSIDYVRLYSE